MSFLCVLQKKKSNPEIVETFYCSLLSRLSTAKFETHLNYIALRGKWGVSATHDKVFLLPHCL